jgi:hypothetical protein
LIREARRQLPPPEKPDFPGMRKGMLEMTRELLAEETHPERRRFYEELIVRLEKQQGDTNPLGELANHGTSLRRERKSA